MEISLTLVWLLTLSTVAGTLDAMAGGGGLLTLPALLATGISPISAFGTNKLQGAFGSFSAMLHFWRKGHIQARQHILPFLSAFLSAMAGTWSLRFIDPQALKNWVPLILILIALWVLFSRQLNDVQRRARLSDWRCALSFIPLIGFYDGFMGPGTGTFFAVGLLSLQGLTLEHATINAKIYNFASNLGALAIFLFSAQINWLYGGVMILGMSLGGYIGARMVLSYGTRVIKWILVMMSLSMSLKLLWQEGTLDAIASYLTHLPH